MPPEKFLFQNLFKMDHWFAYHLGMMRYMLIGVPPVRIYDWEFNENYETDRRWMTFYASVLAAAREAILEAGKQFEISFRTSLDFNPLYNLRGTSPLDSYRDLIMEAYHELLGKIPPENWRDFFERISKNDDRISITARKFKGVLLSEFTSLIDECLQMPPGLGWTFKQLRPSLIYKDLPPASIRSLAFDRLASTIESLAGQSTYDRKDLMRVRFWALDCTKDLLYRAENGSSAWIDFLRLYCRLLISTGYFLGILPT